MLKNHSFKDIDEVLIKNSIFNNCDNNQLILSLDKEYKSLLNQDTQENLEKKLSSILDSKITVKFNFEELNELTITQKNTLQAKNEREQVINSFLKDEGLKKLESIFNAKTDNSTITKGEKNV